MNENTMRAEFEAWVRDCGCDTDGAWSAWQGAWKRRAALAQARNGLAGKPPQDKPAVGVVSAAPPEGIARDAARWRALVNCARIRPLGSAGIVKDNEHDADYAHLGFDVWTKHPPYRECEADRATALLWLERFIEKAERVAAMNPQEPKK